MRVRRVAGALGTSALLVLLAAPAWADDPADDPACHLVEPGGTTPTDDATATAEPVPTDQPTDEPTDGPTGQPDPTSATVWVCEDEVAFTGGGGAGGVEQAPATVVLPRTGAPVEALAVTGLLAVVGGAATVALARRRTG